MKKSDPNQSLSRMQELEDRPVVKDIRTFELAMLNKFNMSDWGPLSIHHFSDPNRPPPGRDATYSGRATLIDAAYKVASFFRVFKGEAWAVCMDPLRAMVESVENPLRFFNNDVIQFHIMEAITGYCTDAKRQGATSRVHGLPKVTQADLVALFQRFIADMVAKFESYAYEKAPHTIMYGAESFFSRIANKPAESQGKKATPGSVTPCHKEGLCFWNLAGALGLTNAQGKPYVCNDSTVKHAELGDVPLAVARNLVQDADFIGVCNLRELKARVAAAVESQYAKFK
jgi:hypothetical protein